MKILVTGAAGFIGFHLVKRLIAEGHEVVGLDNINNYYPASLKYDRLKESGIQLKYIRTKHLVTSKTWPAYAFVKADLTDGAYLKKLFEEQRFTHVCNLAAQAGVRYSLEAPMTYIESNLIGFANLLECCRHYPVQHLVYASSSSVYGLNRSIPFQESDSVDHPVSLYAATKKSNELMAHTYSHLYGLPTTGLRFFTVYGPWGRPDMAYFLFTERMLSGLPIKVFNHGHMQRDFTYIDDIIEGIVRVLAKPAQLDSDWNAEQPDNATSVAPYRIYNIGNSQPVNLLDFIEAIENALSIKADKQMLPIQPGEVETTYADVQRLQATFGYQPKTDIQDGVNRFVEWYREYFEN